MDKTQLWGSMVMEHPSGGVASIYTVDQGDAYSGMYSLAFLLILLVAFRFIRGSIILILRCCFRFTLAWKSQEDVSLETSRVILFMISLLHFSILGFFLMRVYRPDLLTRPEWLMIPILGATFYLLYVAKRGLLTLIGWLVKQPNELHFLAQSPRNFIILAAILSLPLSLFHLFSMVPNTDYLLGWSIIVLIFCFLLFVICTLRLFLQLHFSLFFWILYLCTLEIAPLALLYRIGLII